MFNDQARPVRETILASALGLLGEQGIEATSLRQVARTAGVSAGLVVHHFGGREGLLAAVDEAALREFGAAWAAAEPAAGTDLLHARAAQTARVMREHSDVCAYLGRALVEGTPGSARLFSLMIAAGRAQVEELAERSALRPDADLLWATLQHFFLIWAPLSFMPLLEGVLGAPLLEEGNLDRWVSANVDLLQKGIYQ